MVAACWFQINHQLVSDFELKIRASLVKNMLAKKNLRMSTCSSCWFDYNRFDCILRVFILITHHQYSTLQHNWPFLLNLWQHMSTLLHGWGELWKSPTDRFHRNETSWSCLTVWSLCHYRTKKSAGLRTQCLFTVSVIFNVIIAKYFY